MTPLERAARELCLLDGKNPDEDWRNFGGGMLAVAVKNPARWTLYLPKVRVVLSAIREPGVDVIDQPRGMIMYFNHMQQQKWSLGQHADAGGYPFEVSLTPDERASNRFPKAHQAALIWRVMIDKLLEEGA